MTAENTGARLDSEAALRELATRAGQTPALTKAYVKFWGECGNVRKNAKNPHHKNDYADLEACLSVVKPLLAQNDLALLQVPGEVDDRGNQLLISMLMHGPSGERWTFRSSLPLGDKKTAQAAGSCTTYARRYFILALAGMAPVDDDGNDASSYSPPEQDANAPYLVKKAISVFMAEDSETGKDAAARFSKELKARASASGDPKVVAEYLAKYKVLKAGGDA